LNLGDTFRDEGDNPHLRMVIAGPTPNGLAAIANFSSWFDGCDDACVVHQGDHPYLAHDSFVVYQKARLLPVSDIQRLLDTGYCTPHRHLSNELLKRIRDGAILSDFTEEGIRALILDERARGSDL